MAFQLCALIISVLIISLLILKGLHPILSVIIGCSQLRPSDVGEQTT